MRELTARHGVLLAFDELKTGAAIAYGGASERFGVRRDLVCLAKAIGGGLPCGAIGGSEEAMGLIASGAIDQVGTFNGNPLIMAAVRATLTEVLTRDAYRHLEELNRILIESCSRAIERHGIAAYATGLCAKGSITFSATPVREYRDHVPVDERISYASWLFQHNRGVFMAPWAKQEQRELRGLASALPARAATIANLVRCGARAWGVNPKRREEAALVLARRLEPARLLDVPVVELHCRRRPPPPPARGRDPVSKCAAPPEATSSSSPFRSSFISSVHLQEQANTRCSPWAWRGGRAGARRGYQGSPEFPEPAHGNSPRRPSTLR